MEAAATLTNVRAVTLGKANTVHASEYVTDERGNPTRFGFPLCGQAQGKRFQGTRPVNHKSFDLSKITCAKCATAVAG